MQRSFLLFILLSIIAIGFACGSQNSAGVDSPTEAYKRLYTAVKNKDNEAIKNQLTKKTIEFGAMAATRNGKTPEAMRENGHTETTFSETLPPIRDERIKDNMGAIEVWNSKKSLWEDLPFMFEDGAWKLAVGDIFAGTYKSPGKGRDQLEKEAANATANSFVPPVTNTNSRPITVVNVPIGPDANKKGK